MFWDGVGRRKCRWNQVHGEPYVTQDRRFYFATAAGRDLVSLQRWLERLAWMLSDRLLTSLSKASYPSA